MEQILGGEHHGGGVDGGVASEALLLEKIPVQIKMHGIIQTIVIQAAELADCILISVAVCKGKHGGMIHRPAGAVAFTSW